MDSKRTKLIAVAVILALASLACATIMGNVAEEQAPEDAAAEEQAPPPAPEQAEKESMDVQLGEEYRSEGGGYSFNVIPGYDVEEFFGFAGMTAPDDDQAGIVLMGGASEGSITLDSLYEDAVAEIEEDEDEVVLSNKQSLTVAGLAGYAVDVSGTLEGEPVVGRVVVVAVSDEQEFTMIGFAPQARWDAELEAYFEAVLESVAFFEPTETEFSFEEQPAGEEIHQWASTATASSQYGSPSWAASQATGEPDTLIDYCGTMDTAWASYEGYTLEWIELGFDQAVIPTAINIIQTSAPNQVVKVEVLDLDGIYRVVYTGEPEKIIEGCPYTLTVYPDVDYEVNGVKITIDQTVLEYPWNEIDAVELVGTSQEQAVSPPEGSTEGFVWRFGGEQGYDEGQYGSINGIDATAEGLVYVADDSFGIRLLDAVDGSQVGLISHEDMWGASDVQVAPDGTIVVADWGSNKVFVFSDDGVLLAQIGEEGSGPGQFGTFSPDTLAVNTKGEIYVLDENETDSGESFNRIQVFDLTGKYLREFSIEEDAEIEGMAIGPDGLLYLVDWFGDVLLKYAPDGKMLGKIGEDALYFASPQDVAVDDQGYFYVAVWSPGGVFKLDPNGELVAQFGVSVEDGDQAWVEGGFYSITSVAVLPDDSRVFASDWSSSYAYITAFEFK
ncbi:MAG: 6-bladed beta-propeller [Anaerolineales bacterium]|nr:6-bladed beta-propeller [Anaerolineales bacterium]